MLRPAALAPLAVLAVLAVLVVFVGDARAQDAGPAAPTACGALDDEGECFGDVAAWCTEENVGQADALAPTERFDCARVVVDGRDVDAECVVVANFGAWCGVAEGERCLVPAAGGARQLACLSGGIVAVDGACDLEQGCVRGVAACSDDGPACDGSFLRLGCSAFGQPRGVDCAAIGGTCADAACGDIPEGGPCDRERLVCAGGLECTGTATGPGTCLPRVDPSDPAPREPDPTYDPAPSCRATGGRSGPAAGLWVLGFLFVSSCLRPRIRRSSDGRTRGLGA